MPKYKFSRSTLQRAGPQEYSKMLKLITRTLENVESTTEYNLQLLLPIYF